MPRVSSKLIDKDIREEIIQQFWVSISKINTVSGASQFLSDILTETEKIMLSKRLACAILLIRGRSATEIKNSIRLTYSTIGTVASWVKNAKPETKKILLQFSKEKDWEKIFDTIENFLDKLPSRYGSDWTEAGKQKHKRAMQRSTRSLLR